MKQENILRLLIIDDSSNDAELTVAMLRRVGHGVRALRAAALDALRTVARLPVRDQIGGGFHRSAEHLEKTLSDQA
ncbi:MAG: hypothetical protein ACLGGU_07070, partial [Gammaproteobacteria bacterium]